MTRRRASFTAAIVSLGLNVPFMLAALNYWLEEPKRVVLAGDANAPLGKELIRAAHSAYQPRKVVLGVSGPVEPFAKTLPSKENQPTVYLCTGTSCQPPTHDPAKVRELIK